MQSEEIAVAAVLYACEKNVWENLFWSSKEFLYYENMLWFIAF